MQVLTREQLRELLNAYGSAYWDQDQGWGRSADTAESRMQEVEDKLYEALCSAPTVSPAQS